MTPLEAYASATSVAPGETITFHARGEPGDVPLAIVRRGLQDSVLQEDTVHVEAYPIPADSFASGCGWPAAYTFTVPDDSKSGLYVARIGTSAPEFTEVPFVVRPRPANRAPILFVVPVATDQAYNFWGGACLYGHTNWTNPRVPRVSFDRPYDDFAQRESGWTRRPLPFAQWLEDKGLAVDFCTSVDLHSNPRLLVPYRLLLSVGHDEYWSREMRDNVEAFIAYGGNVAFFSGNVCFYQARFENDGRTLVCYKHGQPNGEQDPWGNTPLSTQEWYKPPVSRPENQMTGVSYAQGGGWWDPTQSRPRHAFQVRNAGHWVFQGTNLNNGDEFGLGGTADQDVLAYETDAAIFTESEGLPRPTGSDGTPIDFEIVATADLRDWSIAGDNGKPGWATMGIYEDNGTVFTAATVDWAKGLGLNGPPSAVDQITENVVRRLSA